MLEAVGDAAGPGGGLPATGGISRRVRPAPAGLRARLLPTYKVLLLGDASVGKTNLMTRFANGQFNPRSSATVGVEFLAREVDLSRGDDGFGDDGAAPDGGCPAPPSTPPEPPGPAPNGGGGGGDGGGGGGGNDKVLLQLWDTAGQEACFALSTVYYRHAHGVVLVYDVTRRETLHNVAGWLSRARMCVDKDCIFVVVGNKQDLRRQVEVAPAEAEEFCHRLGCRHFLASALSGGGVPNAFLQLLFSVHATMQLRACANGPAPAPAGEELGVAAAPVAPARLGKRRFPC